MTRVAVVFNDDAGLLSTGDEKDRLAVAGAGESAAVIAKVLAAKGYLVAVIPVRDDVVGFAATVKAAGADAIFNLCEGFAGDARREGAIVGLLELIGPPLTGNPAATCWLAQDKARAKAVLRAAGVRVAGGGVLASADGPLPEGLRWPAFVKTRYEDASHGISSANLCAGEAALRARAAELIASWKQDVLVEEFLPGRELNVALLDHLDDGPPDVLPIGEIDFSKLPAGFPPIVTYDAKWVPDSPECLNTPVLCPAPLDAPLREAVEAMARAAFAALGCRGYARVDIRLDREGRPVVLEVNPNPDISPDAGFARSASRAGIAHDDLIDRIARLALARRGDPPPHGR